VKKKEKGGRVPTRKPEISKRSTGKNSGRSERRVSELQGSKEHRPDHWLKGGTRADVGILPEKEEREREKKITAKVTMN